MNDITKALLKDLQEAFDTIKTKDSNIEVAWGLEMLVQNIKEAKKLIVKEIQD